MKVSLKWLNTLVKIDDLDPKDIANKLTFAGVEVESIDKLADASGLVIGEILTCAPHPDSDHLHVLNVDEGSKYGIHQIVCGAPNARAGLKVIVAREGAKLPGGVINKGKIRGVESDGMCCALYELGVDKKYLSDAQCNGIEELPSDAPVGNEDPLGYLGLDDTILDLSLLANRSDLNAMENVANEVATLFDREVTPLKKEVPSSLVKEEAFEVGSETEKCPAFSARIVHNVKTKPSPRWLQEILTSEGVRSINNIVDIGNFVMLYTGQPLNMYDLDKLKARSLIVKENYEGPFLAMDDKEYSLKEGDLLVTSENEGVCLAGIMTSKSAEVDLNTKNVVIESAVFNGASIRRTSARLGLASESSSRFVKGINKDQASKVLEMAAQLLVELAEGSSVSQEFVYDTLKHEEKTITTSVSYINSRLGTSFSEEQILTTLTRDHLSPTKDGDSIIVHVPHSRIDMNGEADVSEEVIRLLGFENVKSKLPEGVSTLGLTEKQSKKIAIRHYLRTLGINEVFTYTLVNKGLSSSYLYIKKGEAYKLANPMTDDREYVRRSLLPSLLSVAEYNVSRQIKDFAIFETSDIDTQTEKGMHLSAVFVGKEAIRGSLETRPYDFYSAKGVFEGIASMLGINSNRYQIVRLPNDDREEFHPGKSALVMMGKTVLGVIGELHPVALKKWGLGKNAVALELDLDALLNLKTSSPKAVIPSKFPFMSRDLAFVVDSKVSFADIKREIARADALVKNVAIFDVYQGETIGNHKKSIAITIDFADNERTLKDEEVNAVMEKIIGVLRMKFLAEVRQ